MRKKGAVGIENKNGRSTAEKAARGAQMLKGAVKTAGGIASGNFVTATQGAAEVLSPNNGRDAAVFSAAADNGHCGNSANAL